MADTKIIELLGAQADSLLNHECKKITKDQIHLPGRNFVDRFFVDTNRNAQVLRSLNQLYNHGNLKGRGYMSILPVDQGVEHSAGASFAPNPMYFDSANIVKLAMEGGCNAVASTFGVLASVSRKYAHRIPFIVKLNHNEFLTYPDKFDQIMFGTVENAWNMGAVAVGATIYFGSPESSRQIVEVAKAFDRAHELGMATILWCYTRNNAFKKDGVDYNTATDLSSQANHLGVTIQADIIKQKLSDKNGGYNAIKFGKTSPFAAIIKLSEIPEDDADYPNAGFKLEFDFGNTQDNETEAVDFTGRQALGVCPKCSGAVYEDGMRYVCENNTGPSKTCDFKTGKVVLQQEISAEQVQKLLAEGKTDLLTNFKSNRTGRGFKAYLALGSDGKIGFEFEAKAPKAEGAAKAPAKKRAGASAASKSAAKPKRASKVKSSAST